MNTLISYNLKLDDDLNFSEYSIPWLDSAPSFYLGYKTDINGKFDCSL